MDAEISQLESGVESADCLVWRTAYQLSVRKEKQKWRCFKANHSRLLSIPSAFVLLPKLSDSIPEVECGQGPRKSNNFPFVQYSADLDQAVSGKGKTEDFLHNLGGFFVYDQAVSVLWVYLIAVGCLCTDIVALVGSLTFG